MLAWGSQCKHPAHSAILALHTAKNSSSMVKTINTGKQRLDTDHLVILYCVNKREAEKQEVKFTKVISESVSEDTSDSPYYPPIDNTWRECPMCNKKDKCEITF